MLKKIIFLMLVILVFPLFLSRSSPFSVMVRDVFAKTYPNGTLIRVKGDPKVYLIKSNKKEWIKSPEIFKARKLNWKKVKIISLKEFEAIEEVSDSPTPTSAITPKATPQPSPKVTAGEAKPTPSVSATPVPVKINRELPAPDYIRADWLISQTTSRYGRIGQKIIFKYSDKAVDKIQNFRLYEKKPGAQSFVRMAEFEEMLSTGCEDIDMDKEWMMTEAGQCGYWAMQKIVPPGGREATAYLPAADYSEGEYVYYVVGVDKDGLETRPSPEAKLVFLTTIGIFSPADKKESAEAYPVFKWSIAGGWPAGTTADYLLQISDHQNAQNPFWAKTLKVPAGKAEQLFTYDGPGLNPASKYQVYIYGHYRQSEYDPDYISIPMAVPEFWIKTTGQRVSWWSFLKALLFPFSKVRPLE